ncbi:MAG: hypothetical protein IT372_09415 [Polyangiaceae bacterium]|nr:hypothetical protein [Polyangiaceae bacterium]
MKSLRTRRRAALAPALTALAAAALGIASCAPEVDTTGSFQCAAPLSPCGDVCVDLENDLSNCGACGTACTGDHICLSGSCSPVPCSGGLVACGGVCVDIQTDPQHCGGCDVACASGVPCVVGACQGDCPAGQVACAGGCADLQSDPSNCGGCGITCPGGVQCAGGVCGGPCPPGTEPCGGACVDVASDEQNCGGCGVACTGGAQCVNGACQGGGCGPGLTDCGGVCVDLQTDPAHCGSCGSPCAAGVPCQSGACAAGCPGPTTCGICDVEQLVSIVPQTLTGTTANGLNGHTPSCGQSASPEEAFMFTAPGTGTFKFDTAGSGFDTVLSLLDLNCVELACNDDVQGSNKAMLTRSLPMGESVYVVVEGFGAASGDFQLQISAIPPPACPDADLGSAVPLTVTGTTAGAGNDFPSPCANSNAADVSYTFTAPTTGTFVFDTFGSQFDTILHVHDGTCSGPSLGCNDDTNGQQSQVSVDLTAGQTVAVVVDGFGNGQGNFTLHVN